MLRRTFAGQLFLAVLLALSAAAGAGGEALDAEAVLSEARAEFARADRDGDDKLSFEELAAIRPGADRDELTRQFKRCDLGDDGKLGRGEFLQLISSADERGPIGDPMAEMERSARIKWEAAFAAAGGDNEHGLNRKQWPSDRVANEIPHVAEVTFEQWDRDGDGVVDRSEGNWLLGVAYGLTLPDGRPIRTDQGRVFSWAYFRALDKDQNGVLTRAEFTAGQSAALFEKLDADRDGQLTVEETRLFLWHDTLSNFFLLDRGGDGSMNTDDFLSVGWGQSVARRTVRAFDDDGDGKISFREFLNTTFASYGSEWVRPRRDADDDGRLSWQEFYIEKPPVFIAQSRYFFDRFDRDKDGFLSYAEWEFEGDLAKVPIEHLFAARDLDHDGGLAFAEFFTEPKPPDTDAAARDRYEMRLASEENRFQQSDKDSSDYLDVPEFGESQRAMREAAQRQSKVLADRKTMLEGNYYVRKGVLVVNEILFLAVVWWVVRKAGRR